MLENSHVRAVFRPDGHLTSLFDKQAGREAVAAGALANHFILFDDRPLNFEAWDVDIFHLEKRDEVFGAHVARVLEGGPLRAAIEFETALSPHSWIKQVVSLDALSSRLEFDTDVDWHKIKKFLKVEFPLDVRAANATYEIQFGHLQRPTHFNTTLGPGAVRSACPHKWADLSEPGFGVSLLNDCKYGYAAHGNVLRLSLLRAPTYPDATEGRSRPPTPSGTPCSRTMGGVERSAGVVAEAYRFNVPLLLLAAASGNSRRVLVLLQVLINPAVILDTVKKAEEIPRMR